jgi:hypothetical protein
MSTPASAPQAALVVMVEPGNAPHFPGAPL